MINVTPQPFPLPFQATETEWQAHAFYVTKASIQIGGDFDTQFWHKTIPQLGESELCVRYAIFALGSFSQHTFARQFIREACECNDCKEGLKYYNKAISFLNKQVQVQKPQSLILLSCVLFICIESIQGQIENVKALIRHGYRVIESFDNAELDMLSSNGLMLSLTQIFERLRIMSALFGSPIQTSFSRKALPQAQMDNLSEARRVLYDILNDGHHFRRQSRAIKHVGYVAKAEMSRLYRFKDGLTARLDNWRDEFFNLSHSDLNGKCHPSTKRDQHEAALMSLKAYYFVARIWFATALNPTEQVFHDHVENFRCVVDHASLAIRRQTGFMFEAGVIPPLYFTAIKCRNPQIRRRALTILSSVSGREGLWDYDIVVAVAKRVVELEEESNPQRLFTDVRIGQQRTLDGTITVTYTWQSGDFSNQWAMSCDSLGIATRKNMG